MTKSRLLQLGAPVIYALPPSHSRDYMLYWFMLASAEEGGIDSLIYKPEMFVNRWYYDDLLRINKLYEGSIAGD